MNVEIGEVRQRSLRQVVLGGRRGDAMKMFLLGDNAEKDMLFVFLAVNYYLFREFPAPLFEPFNIVRTIFMTVECQRCLTVIQR